MIRILAILITLFISTSAFSDIVEFNDTSPSLNSVVLNSDKVTSNENNTIISLLDNESSEIELTPLQPQSENHSKSIDFVQPIRASLLTNNINQTPEYILVYELLTAQLDVFANNENRLAQISPAWFMNFSDNSARLSGWKDSNSLYSSKATYHFS